MVGIKVNYIKMISQYGIYIKHHSSTAAISPCCIIRKNFKEKYLDFKKMLAIRIIIRNVLFLKKLRINNL